VCQSALAKQLGLLIRNTLRFTVIAALLATNAGLAWSDDDAGAAVPLPEKSPTKGRCAVCFPIQL